MSKHKIPTLNGFLNKSLVRIENVCLILLSLIVGRSLSIEFLSSDSVALLMFLTVPEVSALLKVPRSWIYNHIYADTLPFPHTKVGHFVRIPEQPLKEWLEKVTRKPGQASALQGIRGGK